MWMDDGDGWRDESTEGPYDTLKTHMNTGYQIFSVRGGVYTLTRPGYPFRKNFTSIKKAKAYVSAQE